MEYARNVLGIADAEHEESSPGAATVVISKLACSLVGKTQKITMALNSIAHRAYGGKEVMEEFFCNYGLNPIFRDQISKSKLSITGVILKEKCGSWNFSITRSLWQRFFCRRWPQAWKRPPVDCFFIRGSHKSSD